MVRLLRSTLKDPKKIIRALEFAPSFLMGKAYLFIFGIDPLKVHNFGRIHIRKYDNSVIVIKSGILLREVEIATRGNGKIIIEENFHCEPYVRLNVFEDGILKIGDNCGIGSFSIINATKKITIGNNVLISSHVHIIDGDHGIRKRELIRNQKMVSKPIEIGDDVWIGTGVKILKGVKIGKGAVIGAGSVVTRDIPPYSIAVGIPARVIKER